MPRRTLAPAPSVPLIPGLQTRASLFTPWSLFHRSDNVRSEYTFLPKGSLAEAISPAPETNKPGRGGDALFAGAAQDPNPKSRARSQRLTDLRDTRTKFPPLRGGDGF